MKTLFYPSYRHLQKRGNREQGTGNREQGTHPSPLRWRGIIDNFWIIIDFIFDFWRCLILKLNFCSLLQRL
ncbi:hypothetical protein D5R40_27520 [Okeania hirsuta]|uniref:Uncharacterized protein n=1 Tax=Okeania hirsuta TaxID=1458930 RepID=A0A3N6P302_9CYAN|nr:hypothetical protein D5R40_27520 [Okeania hirsuta]